MGPRVYLDISPVNIITVSIIVLLGTMIVGLISSGLRAYLSGRGAAQ